MVGWIKKVDLTQSVTSKFAIFIIRSWVNSHSVWNWDTKFETWMGIWVSWLNRTRHPNLPDRSCRTGLNPDLCIFLNILPFKYRLSILIILNFWTQIWCQKFLDQINKQKKSWICFWIFWIFFLFLKVLKVQRLLRKMSGFRTVQILKVCRTLPEVMSSRALQCTLPF